MTRSVLDRDASDPARRGLELVQRGRMILDVAIADLEAAETVLGATHPTCWYFRHSMDDARRSWDRLRVQLGGKALEAALGAPPVVVLELKVQNRQASQAVVPLILIGGRTYRTEAVPGTTLAPVQWRLTRLTPPLEHGPYYACRLGDGSTQCDCAEWYYREDAPTAPDFCKHLAALSSLGWL